MSAVQLLGRLGGPGGRWGQGGVEGKHNREGGERYGAQRTDQEREW